MRNTQILQKAGYILEALSKRVEGAGWCKATIQYTLYTTENNVEKEIRTESAQKIY
jgi:hypothetical protein